MLVVLREIYDLSFTMAEALALEEIFRLVNGIIDAGHLALDRAAPQIAEKSGGLLSGVSPRKFCYA